MGLAADRQRRRPGFSQTSTGRSTRTRSRSTRASCERSFGYAAVATVLCLVISFPLAYFIAFKSGRWKNVLLLLIVLPFFTSYIVRTVAWQTILADDGWVLHRAQDVGLVAHDGRLLATRTAVIAGITYNFLPFMALPLYVALEKIDRRLVEAATDLYASRATAFRKVTLPLALPGVFAGHAADVHPGAGRLHQRPAPGLLAAVHDRQRHPVAVPDRARLPGGRGAELRAHGRDPRRDRALRQGAWAPQSLRESVA